MADPQGQSALVTEPVAQPSAGTDSAAAPSSASWFDALPDGLKANPTLQNFKSKDVSAVAESLVEAQKLIGGSVRLPNEKDTPQERAAKLEKIYTQLGRPEKPDAYKIVQPGEEAGIPWDAKQVEQFRGVAHQLGLTQAQVDGLVQYDLQRTLSAQVDQAQAYQSCMDTLEKDWGAASKTLLGISRRTAQTYFDADTMQAIEATGLANNPAFVKALAKMGKALVEEGMVVGDREGMDVDGGMNGIQAELDRLMSDAKGAYWNSGDPNHEAAVTRAESLRRALVELQVPAR
jgi:hypothetical protein